MRSRALKNFAKYSFKNKAINSVCFLKKNRIIEPKYTSYINQAL